MKESHDIRNVCVIFILSFLLGHAAVAFLAPLDYGTALDGIRRAERGSFADELK